MAKKKRTINALEDLKRLEQKMAEDDKDHWNQKANEIMWRLQELVPEDQARVLWLAELRRLACLNSRSLEESDRSGFLNVMFFSLARSYFILTNETEIKEKMKMTWSLPVC